MAVIQSVYYSTSYNPVVVYVTTNQTEGTITFTETDMFTETEALTVIADPLLTTISPLTTYNYY